MDPHLESLTALPRPLQYYIFCCSEREIYFQCLSYCPPSTPRRMRPKIEAIASGWPKPESEPGLMVSTSTSSPLQQHLLKRRIIQQESILPRSRPCAYLSDARGEVATPNLDLCPCTHADRKYYFEMPKVSQATMWLESWGLIAAGDNAGVLWQSKVRGRGWVEKGCDNPGGGDC